MRCGKESKTKGGRKLNIQSSGGGWEWGGDRRVNRVADGKGHIREEMCRVLHTQCSEDKSTQPGCFC